MKPANRAPFYAAIYHGLAETARAHGYALAIHGSVVTDLDLVAIPWTDAAVTEEELMAALMKHIEAVDYEGLTRRHFADAEDRENLVKQVLANEAKRAAEKGQINLPNGAELKPHGRLAWNLYLDHGAKVDLSVMPRKPRLDAGPAAVEAPPQVNTTPTEAGAPAGENQLIPAGASNL